MKWTVLLTIYAIFITSCGQNVSFKTDPQLKNSPLIIDGSTDPEMEEVLKAHDCSSQSERRVLICHVPPDNPDAAHTLCIGLPALESHMIDHDDEEVSRDTLGPCPAL